MPEGRPVVIAVSGTLPNITLTLHTTKSHYTESIIMDSPQIIISTDKKQLDIDYIHSFLSQSYWAEGIPKHAVEKSINNSFCFGVYVVDQQVGFARVITDFTTFAYLADVFIDETQRGKGIGKRLVEEITNHDELVGLKRWHLLTDDAQKLYSQYGFVVPENPAIHMEKRKEPRY